jgi:hypothetical protein
LEGYIATSILTSFHFPDTKEQLAIINGIRVAYKTVNGWVGRLPTTIVPRVVDRRSGFSRWKGKFLSLVDGTFETRMQSCCTTSAVYLLFGSTQRPKAFLLFILLLLIRSFPILEPRATMILLSSGYWPNADFEKRATNFCCRDKHNGKRYYRNSLEFKPCL